MSSSASDDELGPLIADLVGTLQQLESEFEPRTERGVPRPPSPRELIRFTSDVGIPAAILLLRTNIEALKLLQRALRMADGRATTASSGSSEVRERAQQLSRTTLSRLDGALADLHGAIEGRPEDDDARELLEEARELRTDLEAKLEQRSSGSTSSLDADGEEADTATNGDSVPVDVDAELRSIKDEYDDDSVGDGGTTDDADGSGDGAESPSGSPDDGGME